MWWLLLVVAGFLYALLRDLGGRRRRRGPHPWKDIVAREGMYQVRRWFWRR